jgi:hypothetical protein
MNEMKTVILFNHFVQSSNVGMLSQSSETETSAFNQSIVHEQNHNLPNSLQWVNKNAKC